MRYHLFRSSPKKSLFIEDSQTRDLEFPNINILTLPEAKVNDVQRFIPPKGKYELIAIFVGGNDLYNYCLPSESSVEQVAERICALADQLFLETECVCVSCPPPPRFPTRRQIRAYGLTEEQLQRYTQVNKILGERPLKSKWGYRGISQHVYCESHVSEWDHYHLNSIALSESKTVIKNRVLHRKRYSKKLAEKTAPRLLRVSKLREVQVRILQGIVFHRFLSQDPR